MPTFEWRTFLEEFSGELLEDEVLRDALPAKVVESRWLGYEGASERQLRTLERRLGIELPPSYREFLSVTNGWRWAGAFIYEMLPTKKVDWFRALHQDWIDNWMSVAEPWPVYDEDYFVYGEEQDPTNFRVEYWKATLAISEIGDSAILLLNPEVVTPDGEWEAWFFANWNPGAVRYRSFRELVIRQRESFRNLLK